MKLTIGAITSASLVILGSVNPLFAQMPAQPQQPEFIKQGQQLMREVTSGISLATTQV